ncbi:MAG: glycosyltransferase family 2 protein [Thermoguttaceae bacterium]
MTECELAVVMPVYNEEECVVAVIRSWQGVLQRLAVCYRIMVLNDGSRDRTGEELQVFQGDETIDVVHKANSGHGPTILLGYRRAVEIAPWVFQCDSDDEMKAEHFPRLWTERHKYDALFGSRAGRVQSLDRKILSFGSRLAVRLMFGGGVADVNTAYRLMRSGPLRQIVAQMPDGVFAPNVIISGAFSRAGLRLSNIPVPFEPRQSGLVSVPQGWKLAKTASKCLWQTLCCRPVIQVDRDAPTRGAENTVGSGD